MRTRALALTSVVALLIGALAVLIPVTAVAAPVSSPETRTRTMAQDYSNTEPKGKYKASVTVSQTAGLVHQKVKVSWSGLKPTGTGGITAAPYPVVVMQCWGKAAEATQQTCWNAGANTGTMIINGIALYDTTPPFDPKIFGTKKPPGETTVVPFKARDDGKLYSGTQRDDGWLPNEVVKANPPAFSEATRNAVLPNSAQGFTNADGTGEADIELLTGFELPHLGCSATDACSLVVIPVGDPTCKSDAELPPNRKGQCGKPSPSLRVATTWASPTNWARRFAFDLTFRESATSCQLDDRLETGFAGSFYAYQLLNTSWRAKFCHDPSLFRLGYTALSDGDARSQFAGALSGAWQDGSTTALLTSRAMPGDPPKPVVYAPVAVTGVAVSFVLDSKNGKEVTQLNLNARMLAKMLTQSYRSMGGAGLHHPGVKDNPAWWGADPEFLVLNPGLADATFEANRDGANYPVISLGDLDAIHALTSYIAADKDAVAWLNGADDGHGMFVNPKFHFYQPPVGQLELRDDFIDDGTNSPVRGQIMLSAYANVADNIYNAAIAVAQAWPYANLRQDCVDSEVPATCTLKRIDSRQVGGQRALLAITTLGDSKVFGLRQAGLATVSGKFVKPEDDALALALRGTKLDEKTGVLSADFTKMHPVAYPGTSIVYAAIPTIGLSGTTAGDYAKFLDYAAGPGQTQGLATGQLPDGYVPLSDPLREQTRNAAGAVRDQKGEVPAPPPGLSTDPAAGLLPPAGGNNLVAPGNQPPAAPAGAPPASGASTAPPTVDQAATSVATRTDSSGLAKWVLPGLLLLGVLAGLTAFGATLWTQPQHPVRRAIRAALRRS